MTAAKNLFSYGQPSCTKQRTQQSSTGESTENGPEKNWLGNKKKLGRL
jgi:hypothetical protein